MFAMQNLEELLRREGVSGEAPDADENLCSVLLDLDIFDDTDFESRRLAQKLLCHSM